VKNDSILRIIYGSATALTATMIARKLGMTLLEERVPTPQELFELGLMGVSMMVLWDRMSQTKRSEVVADTEPSIGRTNDQVQ